MQDHLVLLPSTSSNRLPSKPPNSNQHFHDISAYGFLHAHVHELDTEVFRIMTLMMPHYLINLILSLLIPCWLL
jgi:hypothetical protein